MTQKKIDLTLSNLAAGAIQEKLDHEMEKVFSNIHDSNTNAQDKRSITIKLDLTPDENRQTVKMESTVTVKLANLKSVSTTVLTGKDLSSGKVEARELKSSVPGQTYFDDDSNQKTDVGDPIDVIEREQQHQKIINLQKRGNQ